DSTPLENERPAGRSDGPYSLTVYGAAPPDGTNVVEYGAPTFPGANESGASARADTTTRNGTVSDCCGALGAVTISENLYWPGVVGVPARYESTPLLPEKINIPGGRALTAGGTPGASVHVNGPVPVRMRRSIGNQNGEPTDAPGSSSSKLPSTSGNLAPAG